MYNWGGRGTKCWNKTYLVSSYGVRHEQSNFSFLLVLVLVLVGGDWCIALEVCFLPLEVDLGGLMVVAGVDADFLLLLPWTWVAGFGCSTSILSVFIRDKYSASSFWNWKQMSHLGWKIKIQEKTAFLLNFKFEETIQLHIIIQNFMFLNGE